jgi:prepilin-type N-terminal cleavage/methylation domain-containing protein
MKELIPKAFLGLSRETLAVRAYSKCNHHRTAGFTLIELVISAALMSLILVSAYLCMHAALSSQKLIEPRLQVLQSARVAMALITADLRCACPLSQDYEFVGTHRMSGEAETDSLDFATHNYTPHRNGEGDFCAVSVFLDKDARTGQLSLWRRRNPHITLDPLSGGSREQIAKAVRGLKFEYSDGYDWYDTWGDSDRRGKQQFSMRLQPNLSGLPEAVRITLWLSTDATMKPEQEQGTTTNESTLVFQTVARLNLADSGQTAPSIGSSTNSAPDAATPSQVPGPNPGGAP